MKNYFKTLTFALFVSAVAGLSGAAAHASEFLTPSQKADVLAAIRADCRDAWCQGDFHYAFRTIDCDSDGAQCQVGFSMTDRSDSTSRSAACVVKGVSRVEDLLTVIRADYSTLNGKFYDSLTDCIDDLETKTK